MGRACHREERSDAAIRSFPSPVILSEAKDLKKILRRFAPQDDTGGLTFSPYGHSEEPVRTPTTWESVPIQEGTDCHGRFAASQ
jgi:hypothetical protein